MSIFSTIRDKIFGHRPEAAPSAADHATPAVATAPAPAPTPASPPPQVDVEAVLASMADMHGGGGDYKSSIVDLLKLLNMDSSLEARKQLATELGVTAGEAGSAEQNQALHRAVMRKLAENGGQVPASFYSS